MEREEKKIFLVECQIRLLRLLLQSLTEYMHVMSDCHKDEGFTCDKNPKILYLFDLLYVLKGSEIHKLQRCLILQ